MNLGAGTAATTASPSTGHRSAAVVIVAGVALAAAAAIAMGGVELPDLEAALTRLAETLGVWTYVLVAAFAFLETGAFVGLVAPGETAIVLGGVIAAQGSVDLAVMIPLAWMAAALGDLVSFQLGRKLGRRFLVRRGPSLGITAARMERVDVFFERHGPKAIVIGRFIGIVRAVAPFLAGASGMRLRTFLPWSLLGTAAWATTFTLIGFFFQHSFTEAAGALTKAALAVAALAVVIAVWRRYRRGRALRPVTR